MNLTYIGLRGSLIARFGNKAEDLAKAEEEWETSTGGNVDTIMPYRYMSRVFVDGIFIPAIEHQKIAVMEACCSFLEDIFSSGDDDLMECARIRVTPRILSKRAWSDPIRDFAGPLWCEDLANQSADWSWAK
ncbi:hypothetical protein [Catellatospora tritici]|uniref:hypothetical protein n=1 Tax=Catellatospora tritici TaxID=2851566 RepID=UPI001C2D13C8|nr:hypothetical protein [Catellatospora tritici]MBV1855786.1 hypothetical protein [Catellatospora tritici]